MNILNLTPEQLEAELDAIAKTNPPKFIPWTEKEDRILLMMRKRGIPEKVIAKKLNRTLDAVKSRVRRLT